MKSLQQKLLGSASKKISMDRFYALSGLEIHAYTKHRIEKILETKQLLVKNEIEYLLTETGPGNIRLTPELIDLLVKEPLFILNEFNASPQKDTILKQKMEVEEYILKNINSPKTQGLILEILTKYINTLTITSISPLVVDGLYNGIHVSCLIKNGEWITPTRELFLFLQRCKAETRFPIVIAKKISGILFPIFKELYVLGLNMYKIYLPKEIIPLLEAIPQKDPMLPEIKYCNQFYPLPPLLTSEAAISTNNDTLTNFFAITLKSNIQNYTENFFKSKFIIHDNLPEILYQFKKNNTTKTLIKYYTSRQKLLEEV